ncbi:hypothetical protein [Gaopeijia maritima]|uniref:Glycosyltransferase RgtA/B/C/D-like domain-containing protein n=1 Tax=Gaopeijia maritima TaxID=3119007 RepID=A0ABU9E8H8_9BACT
MALIAYAGAATAVFGGLPLHQDSLTQLFQARIFAEGALSWPSSTNPEFFSSLLVAEHEGRTFSQFPPGWAAFLAAGVLLGFPWLVAPAFAAVGVSALYYLMKADGETAATAVWIATLYGVAPWIVFNGASSMNHVPTVSLLLLASVGLARATSLHPSGYSALLAGLALGVATTLRPLEGACFGLPAILWLAVRAHKNHETRRPLGLLLIGGLVPGAALTWYNWAVTGSPWVFGYEVLWGASHGLGFHEAPWGPPHTPARGIEMLSRGLNHLQAVYFESPAPALVFPLLALFLVRRLSSLDRYLLTSACLLLAGYFAYWHEGDYLGPRFLLPLAPLVAIWTARLPKVLADRGWVASPPLWIHFAAGVMLVGGWASGGRTAWREYSEMYPTRRVDYSVLAAPEYSSSILFAPASWESMVATRIWATPLPRWEAQWFFDRIPLCRLDEALTSLEDGAQNPSTNGVRSLLLPLTRDSLLLAEERFSGRPLNPFLGYDDPASIPAQCMDHANAQGLGLAPSVLAIMAALGPTWDDDGPIIAQDMRELNDRLLARHPRRTPRTLALERTTSGNWRPMVGAPGESSGYRGGDSNP